MKSLLALFVTLLLLSCGGGSKVEVGNKTTMEVAAVFDAGDVLKGEVITAKFIITNTGEYPLVIGEVKGSCSCTVAEYPENPVLPGESGKVLAYVNTEKVGAGVLNKSVRIVANTTPSITQVVVKANVIRR
ncbi:MAG: DUF1573 domain-containing protein [Crocinitomicaceae bacterium]|nr:DUF1573 domain-containing protein [Crocinitomicaceae bacterium]MDG1777335.1 DUF1573 domain-containing protein [Crocinitomicaceae bacterium]